MFDMNLHLCIKIRSKLILYNSTTFRPPKQVYTFLLYYYRVSFVFFNIHRNITTPCPPGQYLICYPKFRVFIICKVLPINRDTWLSESFDGESLNRISLLGRLYVSMYIILPETSKYTLLFKNFVGFTDCYVLIDVFNNMHLTSTRCDFCTHPPSTSRHTSYLLLALFISNIKSSFYSCTFHI